VTPRDAKYLEAIEGLIKQSLPRHSLEGLADAVQHRPQESRSRDRRGRDRRGHRERPAKSHGASAPVPHSASNPMPSPVPQPRPAHPGSVQHGQPKHQPKSHNAKPAAKQQAVAATEAKAPGADAMKLPAFLLRPIPIPRAEKAAPRAKKKEAAEA